MNSFSPFLFCIILSGSIFGQKNEVTIDLTHQKIGEISVSHSFDQLQALDEHFIFPSIVPGMYEESNFGKYISDFSVVYKNGDTLVPEKRDVNSYSLENVRAIKHVQYTVKQTTLESPMSLSVFNPGGTFFNDTAYFLLNFHSIVGYFENHQNIAYEMRIKRGKNSRNRCLTTYSSK